MNQVYKVVLCATTGIYKAVPEFARSKSKSSKATVGALAVITAITFSGGAQAATEGIQTGINDVAIGEQATSTGQNNIAIGQGSFAAGGTLTETEANQLIANSTAKINQISNTQKNIAQKELAIAEYLATVEKVERNQAEIERLTVLNEQEKSKTSGLTTSFGVANGIYLEKQAEVDAKVGFLEQLDLDEYGTLDETSLGKIAADVKQYIEGSGSQNSLGDQFYLDYVSAYIEKVGKLEYTIGLAQAAASYGNFYDEATNSRVFANDILGDAAKTSVTPIYAESLPTTPISRYEELIIGINKDRDSYRANKDAILSEIVNTNSQIRAMYGDKKDTLDTYFETYYEYKENVLKLAILRKQTGVMTGDEPDYLAKINQTKALISRNSELEKTPLEYKPNSLGTNLLNSNNTFNAAYYISMVASEDGAFYSKEVIDGIKNAESIQANTLKTYLTDQIAAVKKESDDASKALSDNQKVIAAYELNIKNRQPTAEELQAYNKAKAEEAILIQQKENLANQTAELQALQDELKDGKDALALGANAKAIGDGAVALGANNDVIASEAVALGTGNNVTGDNSVAIGTGNTVSGAQSIAVGTGHTVTGNNSGAFGDPNLVSGNESYAYGNNNTISSDNSHVIGNSNNTAAMSSLIFGNGVSLTAQAANSIVIGSGATSSVNGGVAIGNNSVADRVNTISVGSAGSERQLVNVAAGTNATDAVNVNQLNSSLGNKADVSYVDSSNNQQNTDILANTASIQNKADTTYVDSTNDAQNTIIAGKADQSALDATNQTIADNQTAQSTVDADQNAIISGKADTSYVDSENQNQNTAIGNLQAQTSQNTTDISNKADISYVDDQNNSQNTAIEQNAADILTKADQSALNATNEDVNTNTLAITENSNAIVRNNTAINTKIDDFVTAQSEKDNNQDATIAGKADQSALNATNQTIADNQTAQSTVDADQNAIISGKADTSYVDSENQSQNATIGNLQAQTSQNTTDISNKADISYVDDQNNSQNTAIEQNAADILTKADVSYVDEQNSAQDTAINQNASDILTKADVSYVDEQNSLQNTAISKNATDISNKADLGYVDSENNAQNEAITAVQNQTNQNAIDINNKADTAYVDMENNAQNAVIANKANQSDFMAEQARQDAVNESQNVTISGKVDKGAFEAEQVRQNVVNEAQNIVIATKADTSYVDEKNNTQNTAIDKNANDILAKADVDYVDTKNDAQNIIIASKANQSDFVAEQARQDAVNESQNIAISGKVDKDEFIADQARQDAENEAQNVSIDKNTSNIAVNTIDIADLKAMDSSMVEAIESGQVVINSRVDEVVESQSVTDAAQNRMIAENANRFAGLDQRIGSLDKTLSSGVASALAIGSMPTMSIAGAHMITGGSGYFNGQGSVAVGLTGTTDSGKVSYKIGGSYTQDGGSAFSIGSGYRWK